MRGTGFRSPALYLIHVHVCIIVHKILLLVSHCKYNRAKREAERQRNERETLKERS